MSSRAPIAHLVGPSAARVGEVVRVDGSQSTDDQRVKGGTVRWGDGESLKFVGRPSAYEHVYDAPGIYDVTLLVVDAERQLDTAKVTVTVTTVPSGPPVVEPPPVVDPPVVPPVVDPPSTPPVVDPPPVEQLPVDPQGPSPDGTHGPEVFDGVHRFTLGTDPGPWGGPIGLPVLIDGVATGGLGIAFYFKYGHVAFQTKSGYWYWVSADGHVDEGAFATTAVGERPEIAAPGSGPQPGSAPGGPAPQPGPAPAPPPNADPLPVPDVNPVEGDGSASLLSPDDIEFEKFFDFSPAIGEWERIDAMSAITGRMVEGEPRIIVSNGGDYNTFPGAYEFSLAGLVSGGHINPLRMTNQWKGEDLFAGMPFKPSSGGQGWDTFSADGEALWHAATNNAGGSNPAVVSKRTIGPNGAVSAFQWVRLEGVNNTSVFGPVLRLPKWLQDRYGLGSHAAGWGGGLIQYAPEQSLGLYGVAFPDLARYANGDLITAANLKKLADHSSGFTKTDRWHPPYSRTAPGPFDRGIRVAGSHVDFTDGGNAFDPTHGGGGWVDIVGREVRASRTWTPGTDGSTFYDGLGFKSSGKPSVVSSHDRTIQLGADAADIDIYYGGSLSSFAFVYDGAGSWASYPVTGYDPATKQLTSEFPINPPLGPTSKIDIGGFADPPIFDLEPGQQYWLGATFLQDGKPKFVHPTGYLIRANVPPIPIQIGSRDSRHHMTLVDAPSCGDVEGILMLTPNIDPSREGITRDDRLQWTRPEDPTKGAPDGYARFAYGDSYWSTGAIVDGAEKQALITVGDFSRGANFKSNFHVCSTSSKVELHITDLHHLGEAAQGARALYDVQPTHMMELEPVSSDLRAAFDSTQAPNFPPQFVYARGTLPRFHTAHSAFYLRSIRKLFVAVVGVGHGFRLYQYAVKAGAPKVLPESPDGTEVAKAADGTRQTEDSVLVDHAGDHWALGTTPRTYGPLARFLGYDITVNSGAPKRPPVGLNTIARRMKKVSGTVRTVDASGTWYGPDGPELDPTRIWETTPIALTIGSRKLIGGWQLPTNLWGNLAINFPRRRAFVSGGYEGPHPIAEFELPAMSLGSDPTTWGHITPIASHDPWWDYGYASGLLLWRDKLWTCPKVYYDTAPPLQTQMIAQDGESIWIGSMFNPVGRQAFAGFVKRGPGLDPYIGCGGDESGQGGTCGPTLATLDGKVLITHGRPFDLGPIDSENRPANWNQRAPRPPNYTMAWGDDSWVGFNPRVINGVLEGRWAADRIYGGGLALPEGDICYWARLALGNIDYGWQTSTFVPETHRRTYEYRHDATTFAFKRYELTGLGQVGGQELDADGRVYLTFGPMDPLGGRGYTSLYLAVFA